MFSNFFIHRPRFAVVLSLIIVITGIIAFTFLPIERYPVITPPQIVVRAAYPGASAEVVEKTIASSVETEINGVEDMIYMQSTCSNGGYELNVYFEVGTDTDMAMIRVQNRLNLATPKLPQEVRDQGLVVKERTGGHGIFIFTINSPDNRYDEVFMDNYANVYIGDILSRVPGVGEVTTFGDRAYSMRIWLDPKKMANLGITATEVIDAVRSQNIEVPTGTVGAYPVNSDQQFQYTVKTNGRFSEIPEFENIIARSNSDGSSVKIKDIARVELGAKNYGVFSRINGANAVGMAVNQLADANLIQVVENVKKELQDIKKRMPKGMEVDVVYDAAEYVDESMNEVFTTLFLALFLVTAVIFVFLQNARATFIPALAIPVSVIGTFAFLKIFGFSINTFTLFGLALAIGIVVDDAIVVIENVQRYLTQGIEAKEAALKTMKDVSGAVIATTLVLLAVFIPVALLPGITGKMYKQFSVTIAIAVSISSLVALTLTPALCAVMLKVKTGERVLIDHWAWFNSSFNALKERYLKVATFFMHRSKIALTVLAGLLISVIAMFILIPTGFLPSEDQGFIICQVQLPEGASLMRTNRVVKKVEKIIRKIPEVNKVVAVPGMGGSNTAIVFCDLKKWGERPGRHQSVHALIGRLQKKFYMISEAQVFAFVPPSISGLGRFGGFEFQLQDRGDNSPQYLAQKAGMLLGAANQNPKLERVFTMFQANTPQLNININREKALAQGVDIRDILQTVGTQFGSTYVNDFNKLGRVFQVRVQADSSYRDDIKDITDLYIKNKKGEMVPLNTFVKITSTVGPQSLNRFNMFRSVTINGSARMGVSSGAAIKAMKDIADRMLPEDMSYEWSGTSRQEVEASGQTIYILLLALVFVYLFLVALFESWTLPFGVMLIAPVAVVGGLAAQMISGLSLDLYCQIGLVMLVGMATKHAILIVEFARTQREENKLNPMDAAITAAKLRFRAVLMTVLTFVLSVIPLVIATGAGAESRHSVGITVFGGMITSAIIGTVFVPAFYVIIESAKEKFSKQRAVKQVQQQQEGDLSYEK